MEKFEKKLKQFYVKNDLFTQKRAQRVTGTGSPQIRKWLPEMVRLHKLWKVNAYFFGCSPNELIIRDFGFGEVAICINCNTELSWSANPRSVVCGKCGSEYKRNLIGEKTKYCLIKLRLGYRTDDLNKKYVPKQMTSVKLQLGYRTDDLNKIIG